jgi:hypothetical protein
MKRHEISTNVSIGTAAGVITTKADDSSNSATAENPNPVQVPEEMWQGIKEIMGYSDKELEVFKNQPRTKKIIGRLEGLNKASVIFEVKKSHGCIAGHKQGDHYVFPNGGSMDMKSSSPSLCPFLMPPMARIMWILQERVWEGLHPLPLYATGQCDDVGLECNGWGRVVIEARILDLTAAEPLVKSE